MREVEKVFGVYGVRYKCPLRKYGGRFDKTFQIIFRILEAVFPLQIPTWNNGKKFGRFK